MADRAITELSPVSTVTAADNFVLEQNNRAMRLTGQTLLNWLAPALDGHGGISNIEKTSTSSLSDTYTITYADETTDTFIVKNGKGISSISKSGQSGLTDTYTITYNDATSTTFTVKNGRGIQGSSKSSTGLVDSYTFSYNDGSQPTVIEITNGRGISNIQKTSTSGLTDTYTVTYNDNTTSTFTVTNGAKGDKGNKGDKGDKGDGVTISNTSIQYATSSSGTNPPSTWQDNIPTVTPGNFLWSRTYIQYSDGTDTTLYSTARHGLDGGGGTVRSVHGTSADANGNVDFISLNGTVLTIGSAQ